MTNQLGPVGQEMAKRLGAQLAPVELAIEDQSASHAGHSGARPEGETHFLVDIASAAFSGKTRLERQRLVHHAVGDLLPSRIHALSIKTRLP